MAATWEPQVRSTETPWIAGSKSENAPGARQTTGLAAIPIETVLVCTSFRDGLRSPLYHSAFCFSEARHAAW